MEASNLTNMQKDVLREIGNIGAGNATTSMAALINQKVQMEVPSVALVTVNELMDNIGGPEEMIVAVLFKIEGDVPGTVYFILTIKEAEFIVEQMTKGSEVPFWNDGMLNEWTASILKEAGNILTGSYLSALADFTGLHMKPTVPFLSVDMAAATLVTGLLEVSQMSDYALIIDTQFSGMETEQQANGHFLLIPDPSSIPTLFQALGLQGNE